MDLHVRGNDITISEKIRDFADQRIAKLDRVVDRVVDAKLELRRRHNRTGGDTVTAQLTIHTGRSILRAEEHDRDVEVAIDKVVNKLHTQVRKVHGRRTARKRRRTEPVLAIDELSPSDEFDFELDAESDDDAEVEPRRGLVRTKRFSLKPMDVDEAIEQMELLGHDFYLFQNAAEEQLNVVYRRQDGSYGLLAPSR